MSSNSIYTRFVFWSVWLLIPLLWEILIGSISAIAIIIKYLSQLNKKELEYLPRVTILVPIYNSEATIGKCLQSIKDQIYPKDLLEIFLINNGERDGSYEIFIKFQQENPCIRVWWYDSKKGKSKALNKGIFSSQGKYIINIDSDGWLDNQAVYNVIRKFEQNRKINAMTGVILIDNTLGNKVSPFMELVRKCEFFEYVETFLIGRNFQSITNTMYTLAGAFSCFRKEAILKTHMYNTETVGEDTHMTYQIRRFVGGKILLCNDAFFYVDPIESLDKLYLQRQRWQRGQLEVAKLFYDMHIGHIRQFFSKFSLRVLINDHTLVFPRLIWFFGMIYLFFLDYPLNILFGTNALLYLLYVSNSFIYLMVGLLYLKGKQNIKKHLLKNIYILLIMPIYRFVVYFIRVAGIINSMTTEATWNTKSFSQEICMIYNIIHTTIAKKIPIVYRLKEWLNDE